MNQSEHLYQEIQTLERQLRERDEEIARLRGELNVVMETAQYWVNECEDLASQNSRLRSELSRAAVRDGQLTSELERWLVQEARNGEVGCDYCMAFVADESIEIQHESHCPLATPSPLSDAAQEVLEAARTARHVPGKEWADRAFMCAIGKLWDKVDEYDALLEGRDRKEG